MTLVLNSAIFKDHFGTSEMREIFSDQEQVNCWIDAEKALARVQARLDMIPSEAAEQIQSLASLTPSEMEKLKEGTDLVGYPILPLVRILREKSPGLSGEFLHWGATTQDIMDTGLVLQLKKAHRLLQRDIRKLLVVLEESARKYASLLMAGRTHGIHAVPITLGYKMAVWREEIRRHLQRLREVTVRLFVGQLAGGGGTLASLYPQGIQLQEAFCRELGLSAPPITWHTARDSLCEFVQVQALIASTLGKIANEVLILQHTEIDELAENFEDGRGASSTMPQKANPILSEYILAISKIVRQEAVLALEGMTQDHERGTGQWQVEWKAIPEVCVLTHGSLSKSIQLLEKLEVKPANMKRNLACSKGLITSEALMMALAGKLGRQRSHDIVYQACVRSRQDGIGLVEALLEHPEVGSYFSREQLQSLSEPANYLGFSEYFALGKEKTPQR